MLEHPSFWSLKKKETEPQLLQESHQQHSTSNWQPTHNSSRYTGLVTSTDSIVPSPHGLPSSTRARGRVHPREPTHHHHDVKGRTYTILMFFFNDLGLYDLFSYVDFLHNLCSFCHHCDKNKFIIISLVIFFCQQFGGVDRSEIASGTAGNITIIKDFMTKPTDHQEGSLFKRSFRHLLIMDASSCLPMI